MLIEIYSVVTIVWTMHKSTHIAECGRGFFPFFKLFGKTTADQGTAEAADNIYMLNALILTLNHFLPSNMLSAFG